MSPEELREKLSVFSIPEPNSGCWLWTGARTPQGYGTIRLAGKTVKAHRASWLAATGTMPSSRELVCHKCDNPSCINPTHLFLGDHRENRLDCVRKGRAYISPFRPNPRGEDHGSAKLSWAAVAEIRTDRAVPSKAWAARLSVSVSTIQKIRRNAIWLAASPLREQGE